MKVANFYTPLITICILLQTACSSLQTDNTASVSTQLTNSQDESKPSKLERVIALENQISKLNQRIDSLEEQLSNTQQALVGINQSLSLIGNKQTNQAKTTQSKNHSQSTYQQALASYQRQQYTDTVQLLQPYNQNYKTPAANYLMIQAHFQLQNCESVINLGKNFQRNLPKNSKAADALLLVASCQHQMQQKDVAKETWRYIIQAYPNSVAAGEARVKLKT